MLIHCLSLKHCTDLEIGSEFGEVDAAQPCELGLTVTRKLHDYRALDYNQSNFFGSELMSYVVLVKYVLDEEFGIDICLSVS